MKTTIRSGDIEIKLDRETAAVESGSLEGRKIQVKEIREIIERAAIKRHSDEILKSLGKSI